jgi:hypothetical protein
VLHLPCQRALHPALNPNTLQVAQLFQEQLEKQGAVQDAAEIVRSQAQRIVSQRQTVRAAPRALMTHVA